MKKSMKSAFALMLTMIMILGAMPAAMAADITIAAPTVTTFGEGVSFFAGSEATDDGEEAVAATGVEVLTNGKYYGSYEVGTLSAQNAYTIPYGNAQKAELVTFTQTDSGIEYKWDNVVTVKRLELWILGVGGVKDYEVQSSADGSVWSKVEKTGSFADYSAHQNADGAYRASYYPIIFDEQVTTQYLRFVIKSFQEGTTEAKIAETRVSDTNEINLAEHSNICAKGVANPYLWEFNSSGSSDPGVSYTSSKHTGAMWPVSSNKVRTLEEGKGSDSNNPVAEPDDGIWYVTTFDRSLVKVNKVGLTLNRGSIDQFEVWATDSYDFECKPYSADPDMPDTTSADNIWTKVATIDYYHNSSTSALFELPDAFEARAYLIKIPAGEYQRTPNAARITSVQMYAFADSELAPAINDAALTGEVEAGKKVTFSAVSANNLCSRANVIFALYSGDALYDVAMEECTLTGKVKEDIAAEYTIPAGVSGELSVKAFVWDVGTLKPLLSRPAEIPEISNETE